VKTVPDLFQLIVNFSTSHVLLADIVTEIQFYKYKLPKEQTPITLPSNVTDKKNPRANLEFCCWNLNANVPKIMVPYRVYGPAGSAKYKMLVASVNILALIINSLQAETVFQTHLTTVPRTAHGVDFSASTDQ
jgi:hypothetical protein